MAIAPSTDPLANFDPSDIGLDNGNLGGLPFDYGTAQTIVFGVPWEVTVSYGAGTAEGPRTVLEASRQLDLYDFDYPDGWKQGIFMPEMPQFLLEKSNQLREAADQIIEWLEQGRAIATSPELTALQTTINHECAAMTDWLFQQAQTALSKGKRIAVVGGDHSVPLGAIRALAERYPDFGILHIDAHADLREAYEGFEFSHASIMFNVLKLPQVSRLVQVGIRDVSHNEIALIEQSEGRVQAHFDPALKQKLYAGIPWIDLCRQIIATLPPQVYISFDVDGLDPKLCPHTGTPVPGGLELEQAFALFREVVASDRQIIGFDVSEVGNAEWDGNVGARAVYKLCNLMALSQRQI